MLSVLIYPYIKILEFERTLCISSTKDNPINYINIMSIPTEQSFPVPPKLIEILERDKATIVTKPNIITRQSRITYTCACGNQGDKLYDSIIKTGAHCRTCIKAIQIEKFKQTNLERFGVEYPMQNKDIINKRIQTIVEHIGVSSYMKLPEFLEKKALTSIERFGTPYPIQRQDIRDKRKQTINEREDKGFWSRQRKDVSHNC